MSKFTRGFNIKQQNKYFAGLANKGERYQNVTAHEMVAELAVAMAQETYEELASKSDVFYGCNKNREDFVRHMAPLIREEAKQFLAGMLNDNSISDVEKEQIYEALKLDRHLKRGVTTITKE